MLTFSKLLFSMVHRLFVLVRVFALFNQTLISFHSCKHNLFNLSLSKHLTDIAEKNSVSLATRWDLKIDNLLGLIIIDLKQVRGSIEEQSSVETLSQLEQVKLLFVFGFHLTYI